MKRRCVLCEQPLGIRVWTVSGLPGAYCRKCAQKLCEKGQVPVPHDERKK